MFDISSIILDKIKMKDNILTKNDFGDFYENRKKFDDLITDLLGADTHLHDISADNSENADGSFTKPNVSHSAKNLRRTQSKFDDYSLGKNDKMEKLYKSNIDMQNKIMSLNEELQNKKNKA